MPDAVSAAAQPAPRPSFYRRWLSPEGYLGLHLVVGFFLAVAAAAVFDRIADWVFSTQNIRHADFQAQQIAHRLVSPRMTMLMIAISLFGRLEIMAPLSVLVILWLLKIKSHRRLYAFAAAMAGGALLNGLLKVYFHRARPASSLVLASGYSFPSGHAMGSVLFFGSLAYVVYFTIEHQRAWRLAAVLACGLSALAIGASRIYLGVHYFSDVVAGFVAGIGWMAVCFSGTEAWVRWRDYRRSRHQAAVKAAATKAAGSLLLALLLGRPAAAATAVGPPCAECVAWEATTEQAEALLGTGDRLAGVEVVMPAAPGAEWPVDLLSRLRERGAQTDLLLRAAGDSVEEDVFRLKTRATELRSQQPSILLGLEAKAPAWPQLWQRGLGAYIDFVVAGANRPLPADMAGVPVWRRFEGSPSIPALLSLTTASAGERVLAPAVDPALVLAMARLGELLPAGLSPLGQVRIMCEPARPSTAEACTSRVFLHPRTLEAIALVDPYAPLRAVSVAPGAMRIEVRPLDPGAAPGETFPAALGPHAELPGVDRTFLLRIAGWSGADEGRFISAVDVTGQRSLTVEEVIARHQAAAARQRRQVRSLIASGTMVISFQVPGLDAPMTISSETVIYEAPGVSEVEQRHIRLNGLDYETEKDGVPRLPIVEPERVSEPPLAISLSEVYRYHLEGREKQRGRDAYVLAFEPKAEGRSLFRGRVWIDADSFAMLRVAASQTSLRGAIISAQQEDEFVPVEAGGRMAWLLGRSEAHQVYAGAGYRTPIHRVLTLAQHEPNPAGFAARLAAAHASPAVMMQETPEGFRYLRRIGKPVEPGNVPGPGTQRVAAGKAQRVRTIAAGVLVDPDIDHPLPFAALSYVDFDFLGTGAQVNAFCGGAFAQAAFAVPSLGGTRLQLHGTGFATFVEYNDRSFREGVEVYAEDVRQRPARLTLGLLRPLGPRWRARADYELGYTRFRRAGFADPAFAPPASTPVHGLRLALEAQQGPWSASLWWGYARRQRWPAWGFTGNPEFGPQAIGFQRYGADAGRSFVFSPRAVGQARLSWMAGRGLDRFSRFTFDGFDNRLRGYPSAGLRYDRGALLRTAASWNAARRLRLDGFLDGAFVRDPGFGPREKPYLGAGAGVETVLPHGLLLAVDWGYGFQARDREGRKGAQVLRATAFKVF